MTAVAKTIAPPVPAPALAYVGLTVTTVGWAAAFVAGKVVLGEMTPLAAASWRYAVASIALLPFALRGRPRHGVGAAAVPLAVMVVCGGIAYPWLFLLALRHTTATNTSLIIATSPVITMLLTPFVGERLDGARLGGIGVALAGAVVVITHGDVRHLAFNPGDVLALVAAGAWAAFNLAARGVVARLAPPFVNCVVYGVGGLALGALGRGEHPGIQLAAATPTVLTAILVMALLSSALSGQLFLVGVRAVGVGRAVVFIYLVPVFTALMATTFLGEGFGAAQALGGAGVVGGLWLTTRGTA